LSDPKVSIGIRAWRRETLPAAIESVLAQGHDDLELIVGDDAGDLGDVAARFDDPRVRYVRNPVRLGLSGNARALTVAARGRYIGLLDDDNRMLPGYLDATVARLDEDPRVGIAFTNWFHEADGRLLERDWPLRGGRHDDFLDTILRGCPAQLSSALIRREAWEEGELRHPIRDDASVDMTVWMRTAEAGWSFHFIDQRLIVHRVHAGQVSNDEELIRERAVAVWSRFRFDDPVSEGLRRRRVAEALLDRANLRLRQGKLRAAGRDVRAARRIAPEGLGERGVVAVLGVRHAVGRLLARYPRLLRPALLVWGRLQRFDRFR